MAGNYWSSGTTSTTIWADWSSNDCDSSGTIVWGAWSGTQYSYRVQWPEPEPETPEQTAAREAQAAEYRRQSEERERERREAEERADKLLRDNLTPEQLAEYEQRGFFHVHGERAKYRIRKGRMGNIDVIEGERVTHRLCVHPSEAVPDQDTMLAQKLALECDEPGVLRLANRHEVYGQQAAS